MGKTRSHSNNNDLLCTAQTLGPPIPIMHRNTSNTGPNIDNNTYQSQTLHQAYDTHKGGQDTTGQHQHRVCGHELAEPRPSRHRPHDNLRQWSVM